MDGVVVHSLGETVVVIFSLVTLVVILLLALPLQEAVEAHPEEQKDEQAQGDAKGHVHRLVGEEDILVELVDVLGGVHVVLPLVARGAEGEVLGHWANGRAALSRQALVVPVDFRKRNSERPNFLNFQLWFLRNAVARGDPAATTVGHLGAGDPWSSEVCPERK